MTTPSLQGPLRVLLAGVLLAGGLFLVEPMAAATEHCENPSTAGPREVSPYLPDEALHGAAEAGAPQGHMLRSYVLFGPEGLSNDPVPLVVAMHGLGGSAAQLLTRSGLMEVAAAEGFVLAAPSGNRSWDNREASTDIGFVRDVIADVRQRYCIDAHQIFALGHSNGAMMALRLACDAGDLVAAVASYAPADLANAIQGGPCDGGASGDTPESYVPVPIAIYHGDADSINDHAAGARNRDAWLERYDCDTIPVAVDTDLYGSTATYGHCARPDAVERTPFAFVWRTLAGHDHGWPDGCGGGTGVNQSPTCDPGSLNPAMPDRYEFSMEIWNFLRKHPRPSPAIDQSAPGPAPADVVAPPDGERTVTWASSPRTGADSESSIDLLEARRVGGYVELRLRLEVNTILDPLGAGTLHPTCPTEGSGQSRQPAGGRELEISLGDGTEAGTTSATVVTQSIDGNEFAFARLPAPRPKAPPAAIRALYAGDNVRLWATCGSSRAFFKQTVNAAGLPKGHNDD